MTAVAERKICGAKRKQGRGVCQVSIVYPNGRCRVHGGPTPSGPDSANWKHGEHSKWGVLPKDLAEHYARTSGRSDAAIMTLTDEIVLIDARVSQLLGALEPTGSVKQWTEVRARLDAFRAAVAAKTGVLEAIDALETAIDAGAQSALSWDSLLDFVEQRRKLVDTESKRRKDAQEMISARQAIALVSYVVHAVREHVTDPIARAKLVSSLQKVLKGESTTLPGQVAS